MNKSTVACVLTLGFCAAAADAQTLNTDQDKTLYELALVTAGLSDSVQGKTPKVDLQTYGPKIKDLEEQRGNAAAANEKKASGAFLEKMSKEPGAVRSSTGVIYIPVTAGTGASPKAESTVKVHY